MGKKKPQKTKELSVAIAEASSTGDEGQQQPQAHTPRKRGRPRKIIEKIETAEEQSTAQTEELSAATAAAVAEDVNKESRSKKAKASEDEDQQEEKQKLQQEEGPSSSSVIGAIKKEDGQAKVIELSREPSRSRARRKSKPRKSSS